MSAVFVICTGRNTHEAAEPRAQPLPAVPGPGRPQRTGPWPWSSHIDYRCPECGLRVRIGARKFAGLLAAHAAGVTPVDISFV